MKKIKIILPVALLLGLFFISCEKTFNFDQELYKKVVNLITNSNNISDRTVVDLNNEENTLYVGIGLGGTEPADKDLTVELEQPTMEAQKADRIAKEYKTLFNRYNKSHYDIDSLKYARLLKPNCYTIPTLTGVIKKGDAEFMLPITLKNLEYPNLSPDTTYFIELGIKSVSDFEVNRDKNKALYQIFYKNEWASTKSIPVYTVLANKYSYYRLEGDKVVYRENPDTLILASSPKVFPLTKNTVRVAVGDLKTDTLGNINKNSMILTIADDKSISVTPYKKTYNFMGKTVTKPQKDSLHTGYIYVETIAATPEYPNKYIQESFTTPTGASTDYKTFKFRYRYYIGAKQTPLEKDYILVEQRMRLKYNKLTDK